MVAFPSLPMHLFLAILMFLALPISAANNLIFKNHCSYSMYFWIARPNHPGPSDNSHIHVPSHDSVIHGLEDPPGGGLSLKIRDLPYYAMAPAGIVQAEYNVDNGVFWYDLSMIDCNKHAGPEHPEYCPFVVGGIELRTTSLDTEKCPIAHCQGDPRTCGKSVYMEHGTWKGEPNWRCEMGHDLILTTCTHGDGIRSISGQSEGTAPPAPLPVPPASKGPPETPPMLSDEPVSCPPPSTVTSVVPPPTIVRDANGLPSPTQPGTISCCTGFHFVVENDNCWALAHSYGITVEQFYAWNPNVGTECETLWLGYWCCVVGGDVEVPAAKETSFLMLPSSNSTANESASVAYDGATYTPVF